MKLLWRQNRNKLDAEIWDIQNLLPKQEWDYTIASILATFSARFKNRKIGSKLSIEHKSSGKLHIDQTPAQPLVKQGEADNETKKRSGTRNRDSKWCQIIREGKIKHRPLSVEEFMTKKSFLKISSALNMNEIKNKSNETWKLEMNNKSKLIFVYSKNFWPFDEWKAEDREEELSIKVSLEYHTKTGV